LVKKEKEEMPLLKFCSVIFVLSGAGFLFVALIYDESIDKGAFYREASDNLFIGLVSMLGVLTIGSGFYFW